MPFVLARRPAYCKMMLVCFALQSAPMTLTELAATIHASRSGADHYVRLLHQERQIYICGWHATCTTIAPIYAWGDLPDAPRPALRSQTERARAYRDRVYADPMRHDVRLAKRRARRAKPQRDPLVAAFFGAA